MDYDEHNELDRDKQWLPHNVIGEMSELSNRLRNAERVKSHFLSNVRNEIYNPLMAIMGLSVNMRDSNNVNLTTLRQWADLIHKEAFNLNFLLSNIFVAADIEAGDAIPQPSSVNIAEVIRYHIGLLKQKADERNVQIEYTAENTVDFKSDSHMLQRIMMNLLHDTLECCPAEKKISVTGKVIENELFFVVEHDAPMIDETILNPVYDRLRHLNPALENNAKNYGLSLSVVKELTAKLEGSIEIESEINLSRVTVRIPALGSAPSFGQDLLFGQEEIL
jgi:signal transduction histidine kinase